MVNKANLVTTENQLKHCWKKITGDDTKKTKRLTEIQALTKDFVPNKINCQSTIKRSPLIHGQINFIKFVELNKFDNVYSKTWHLFRVGIKKKYWFMKKIDNNFLSCARSASMIVIW